MYWTYRPNWLFCSCSLLHSFFPPTTVIRISVLVFIRIAFISSRLFNIVISTLSISIQRWERHFLYFFGISILHFKFSFIVKIIKTAQRMLRATSRSILQLLLQTECPNNIVHFCGKMALNVREKVYIYLKYLHFQFVSLFIKYMLLYVQLP